jgi:hypothetical protein
MKSLLAQPQGYKIGFKTLIRWESLRKSTLREGRRSYGLTCRRIALSGEPDAGLLLLSSTTVARSAVVFL